MRKTLLSLGTIAAIVAPVVATVSCSKAVEDGDYKFTTFADALKRYEQVNFETRQINNKDGVDYVSNVFREPLLVMQSSFPNWSQMTNEQKSRSSLWSLRRAQETEQFDRLIKVGQIDAEDDENYEWTIFKLPDQERFDKDVYELQLAKRGIEENPDFHGASTRKTVDEAEAIANSTGTVDSKQYIKVTEPAAQAILLKSNPSLKSTDMSSARQYWFSRISANLADQSNPMPLVEMVASNAATGDLAENWDYYHLDGHNGWEWENPSAHTNSKGESERYVSFKERANYGNSVDAFVRDHANNANDKLLPAKDEVYAKQLREAVRKVAAEKNNDPKYLDQLAYSDEKIENLSFYDIFGWKNNPDLAKQKGFIVVRTFKPNLRTFWDHTNPTVFAEICYITNVAGKYTPEGGTETDLHGSLLSAISFANLTAK